jgi:hypothetical protein
LLLAMSAVRPLSAQSPSAPVPPEAKDDLTITDGEIEQRARLLELKANISNEVMEISQELVRAKSTQRPVARAARGRSAFQSGHGA